MIQIIAYPLWVAVTSTIYLLSAFGITAEWGASRLTGLQKFLRKTLDGDQK